MPEPLQTCPQCGSPLPTKGSRGLCPSCVMEQCLTPQGEPTEAGDSVDQAWLDKFGIEPKPAVIRAGSSFGDYELLDEIGRGGMGVIYKARQTRLNRTVAIKMILAGPLAAPAFIQRFRTEAEAAANLDHPNIVPIYEIGEHEGRHFYSMKLVEGPNLAEVIQEWGRRKAEMKRGAESACNPEGHRNQRQPLSEVIVAQVAQPAVSPTASRRGSGMESSVTENQTPAGWQPAKQQTGQSALRETPGSRREAPAETSAFRTPHSAFSVGLQTSAAALLASQPSIAKLLATLAHAIHYAHQRGVLHRDLKPANILIDSQGQPHITDFGLAKLLDKESGLTLSQAVLGTPSYMAPEQAAGKTKELTIAADVYSLGAILYELLTGQPLFRAEMPLETMRQVVENEPKKPSQINPAVNRDLATICLKCLGKAPQRRYPTAQALAEGLERWVAGEPIQARPVSTPEKAWRWCRRKPVLAGLLGALIVSLSLGFASVLWQSAARKRALTESRRTLYAAQMNLVQQAWNDGAIERAQALLRAQIPKPGKEDLRGFEWRHLWRVCRDESAITLTNDLAMPVQSVAVSPDGEMIVFGGWGGLLGAWRFDSSGLLPRFSESPGTIRSLVFLPDGSRIACGYSEGNIKLWDLSSGELRAEFKNLTGRIECVRVAKDGRLLAGAEASGIVRLFSLETMREVAAIPGLPNDRPAVAFSHDGKTLAISRSDGTVVLWHLERMTERKRLPLAALTVGLDFSPDDRWLAGAGADAVVRVWDVRSPGEPAVLLPRRVWAVRSAFRPTAPSSRRVASMAPSNCGMCLRGVSCERFADTMPGRTTWCSLAMEPNLFQAVTIRRSKSGT